MYKTNYSTLAQIVADHGEAKIVNWLNGFFGNQNYRQSYNKTRNEAFKVAKSDPRFKELFTEVRKEQRKAVVKK